MPDIPQWTEQLVQGDDFSFQMQWTQNGVAVDMTGFTVEAQVRAMNVRNATKFADCDWAFVSAGTGVFKITLPDTTTDNVVAPSYVTDVKTFAPDGTEETILGLRLPVRFTANQVP